MAKSKKPFIDRQNYSTYHLLHRSQRDVGNGVILEEGVTNASGHGPLAESSQQSTDAKVLLSQENSARMTEWRENYLSLDL